MYVEKAKPDKQFNYAFENEIPIILWLAEEELKAGEVKIKVPMLPFRSFTREKNTPLSWSSWKRTSSPSWMPSERTMPRAR